MTSALAEPREDQTLMQDPESANVVLAGSHFSDLPNRRQTFHGKCDPSKAKKIVDAGYYLSCKYHAS